MKIASSVRELSPYVPGEQPKDANVVKLNTNENPYPPSPRIREILAGFPLDHLRRYPDPVFSRLREKLAACAGTVPERVFVGNGSDEILSLAARAFVDDGEAIGSFDPSYSLYRTLAAIRGVPFVPSPLAPDFTWAEPVIRANGTDVSLFLITNPNAPTSLLHPRKLIEEFADGFPGVVIVDEAYVDFADDSCMELATGDRDNVIVMRTFSKSFSLAGLRVGWCVGPAPLVDALYKIKDSYNVDAIAQAVACAAIDDAAWMRANVERVRLTRETVAAELRRRGWDVPPSQSNFLFARPPSRSAAEIFESLRERHIYVRYFPGPRTGDRLRITIGTPDDMVRLLSALEDS